MNPPSIRLAILLTTALIGLLVVPGLTSAAWLDAGHLLLRDDLARLGKPGSESYDLFAKLEGSSVVERSVEIFRSALALDSQSYHARWALGRALLSAGEANAAVEVLAPLSDRALRNPLVYYDLLIASSQSKRHETVIQLYEANRPQSPTQAISDTVALAYIELGRRNQAALEAITQLRPGDLYANHHLWQTAALAGDRQAMAYHSTRLTAFQLGALVPVDKRLVEHVASTALALFDDELWERVQARNVLAFLVWQYSSDTEFEYALEGFAAAHPSQPEWLFLLGELYQRRGDWMRALQVYRRVIEADPAYTQAYLRLGMITETAAQGHGHSQPHLQEAADWYRQYRLSVPDDILALESLAKLCERLSCRDREVLQDSLEAALDGRQIAAEALGIPLAAVSLGQNIVVNGDFEEWEGGQPSGWRFSTYLGWNRDQGLYVAGQDTLWEGDGSGRITTLRGGESPDGTTTYGEYIGEAIRLGPSQHLITIRYRVEGFAEGDALVYVGEYRPNKPLVLLHAPLQRTMDGEYAAHFLVEGPTQPTLVHPIVRVWGNGHLWTRVFEIRPVTVSEVP